jgi:hypothetical protein
MAMKDDTEHLLSSPINAARLRRSMRQFGAVTSFVGRYYLPVALGLLLILALAGCTTTRYVPTHCLTPAQYDALAAQMPPKIREQLTGKADSDIKIIAASGVRLRGYADGLLGVLKGCVGER